MDSEFGKTVAGEGNRRMPSLQSGQNASISGARIEMRVANRIPAVVDVSAYLLDASGRVRGDGDMVFYGQTTDASGSLSLVRKGTDTILTFDLARIPAAVDRIAVCAAIDGDQSPGTTFAQSSAILVAVGDLDYAPDLERPDFRALTLVEVYRRSDAWKVRAIGQGFAGGLRPLSIMYGVDVAEDPSPAAASGPPPVSLSKISLTKNNPSVDLRKAGGRMGSISVNLNWNRGSSSPRRGFLGSLVGGDGSVDLDLGCLWEMDDGSKGAVQALGNAFGSLDREPFIRLSGDDRSGDSAEGEWLHVSGGHWDRIRRILIYAFIYGGVPDWDSTDGVVAIAIDGQPPIEVRLDESSGLGMCAIALLENVGGDIRVGRKVRYFKGHRDMDREFGWNMRWAAGSK